MSYSPLRTTRCSCPRSVSYPVASLLLVAGFAGSANAGEIADALNQLVQKKTIQQSVMLSDLGVTRPLSLAGSSARRDIYLPVPSEVPLEDAVLDLKGHYLHADGGETTYTLSLDSYAVAARSLTGAEGNADIQIGVDGAPRESGFLHLGINWSSASGKFYCDDAEPIGNILQILPETRLNYSYMSDQVTDIASAWAALPLNVDLMISGETLDEAQYDAAWRIGTALEKAGKHINVIALPRVGDIVDAEGIAVPTALLKIPAFSKFSDGGAVKLNSEAELGAFLLLRAPSFQPDVLVMDAVFNQHMTTAFSALSDEIAAEDSEAAAPLRSMEKTNALLIEPLEEENVGLRFVAGRPVIAVSQDGTAEAAGLFDTMWRNAAAAEQLSVRHASTPQTADNRIALGAISQAAGDVDVVSQAEWSTTFNTGDFPVGKTPAGLDLKVSAAPGATATKPVASVFLNGYLLGAKQLTSDGQPEAISVKVPSYALLPRNTISVRFQRQPASDHCRETPQAFPAAVLPDSQIILRDAPPADGFVTLAPHMSGDTYVAVPNSRLSQATHTLPTVVHVAGATGISPSKAEFSAVEAAAVSQPDKPFLFFDIAGESLPERVKTSGEQMTISAADGTPLFDVAGLSNIAVLEAVHANNQAGLSYQSVGSVATIDRSFQLPQGDVAIIGENGVLASANTSGKPLFSDSENPVSIVSPDTFSLKSLVTPEFWTQRFPWFLTIAIVGGFVVLTVFAKIARRRAEKGSEKDQG